MERFVFENKGEFIAKLRELVETGVPPGDISTVSPFRVHEVEELLSKGKSGVRVFALLGALAGLATGFAFTIYTVETWHLRSGGKPLVAIPAFLIIAFALTILFGSLASFAGFLITARLPRMKRIVSREDFTDRFEIIVRERD